jgi:hypothetical protein
MTKYVRGGIPSGVTVHTEVQASTGQQTPLPAAAAKGNDATAARIMANKANT